MIATPWRAEVQKPWGIPTPSQDSNQIIEGLAPLPCAQPGRAVITPIRKVASIPLQQREKCRCKLHMMSGWRHICGFLVPHYVCSEPGHHHIMLARSVHQSDAAKQSTDHLGRFESNADSKRQLVHAAQHVHQPKHDFLAENFVSKPFVNHTA